MIYLISRFEWVDKSPPGDHPRQRARNEGVEKKMNAIIVTGGKQYKVAEGDVLFIEKLDVEAGETVKFEQVLAILDGENTKFGTPSSRAQLSRLRSSRTARARRLTSSATRPRRARSATSAIVSPTPRSRSPRSLSNL